MEDTTPYRILLAEDNPVNQDVSRGMLEFAGCDVDVASNGEEAVTLFSDSIYDMVFMDCEMPVMDGYTAAGKIREYEKTRIPPTHTPIIALTAHTGDEEREKCLRAGMNDCLSKPFKAEDIKTSLAEWIIPVILENDVDSAVEERKGAAPDTGNEAELPAPAHEEGPALRILLVEDTELHAQVFRFSFEKEHIPCEITHTPTTEAALERLLSDPHAFDVVVADYLLPGRSGIEICKEVHKQGISLPVVILTAEGSEDVAVEALKSGAYDYIIKDFNNGYANLLPYVIPDVIRKHRDDLKRQRTEEENRAILETVTSGVITTDDQGLIQGFNPAAEKMFGYSSHEIMGRHLSELMPQAYSTGSLQLPDRQKQDAFAALSDIIAKEKEVQARRRDGSGFPMEISVSEMRVGHDRMFVAVLSDITRRKNAETALISAKESAEASSKVKTQFLANISHETRTPLNAVLGLSEVLLTTELSEKQRKMVKDIRLAGQTLLKMINNVLDFSEMETRGIELEQKNFNLRTLIEHLVSLFSEQARDKGLTMTTRLHPDVPAMAWGDENRLRQILMNLISNAVKFTEQGSVSVSAHSVRQNGSALALRFEVKDTGIGISPDVLEKIFNPFSQADDSSTRNYGGAGLGLTIANHLIQMMNGSLYVKSDPGKGSKVWFTLQLEQARVGQAEPEPAAPLLKEPRFSGKILLVEDNPVNQEVARGMLEHYGCGVETASDGKQAVETFSSASFDLVFMDCQMPKMDGYAASREMRKLEASRKGTFRTPIIALTAQAMEGDEEKCLAAGMDAYMSKPFKPETLQDILSRWLVTGSRPEAEGSIPHRQPEGGKKPAVTMPASAGPVDAGDENPPVDIHVLNSIRALQRKGKPNLVEKVITHYLHHAPELMASLRLAESQNNPHQIEDAAHSLKSSSGNVGALSLADLCRELEALGRSHDLSRAPEILAQMEKEFKRVTAALEAELLKEV
jgi:PAS domain S-box-containing protein